MLLLIIGVFLIAYLWTQQNTAARVRVHRALAFVYLWTKRKFSTPKFNFDPKSINSGQLGIVPLPEARKVESPRPLLSDVNAVDSLRFYGVNRNGAALCVQLDRRHGRCSEAAVYLRLPSGEQYQLPGLPDSRVYNTDANRFSAAGLAFQVLEPLRRWRVTFNGYLRKLGGEAGDDEKNGSILLVKFNLMWTPINNYEIFPDDFDIDYMSKVAATTPGIKSVCHLSDHFPLETLEQCGQLYGMINIEGQPEQQMLVRGIKKRRHGIQNWDNIHYSVSIEGYLDNATNFHLFAENVEGGIPNFVYGYVNQPCNMKVFHINECKFNFQQLVQQEQSPNKINIKFVAGGTPYNLQFQHWNSGFVRMVGEQWQNKVTFQLGEVILNGKKGQGAVEISRTQTSVMPPFTPKSLPLLQEPGVASCPELTVSFRELNCRSSKIVGGKGSSLALMTTLEDQQKNFSVPPGLCITQTAFALHLKENPTVTAAISQMENVAWKRIDGNLSEECGKVVTAMNETTISHRNKEDLKVQLTAVFGDQMDNFKFAVRSSAIGEDGEEMSAAGQNETILGVKGFDQILSAVITCWASQFAFRSVEYKRQNGQLLNAGMGVVVQQMVPADVAGVLFSRDPLTGSLGKMILTSNYGLGESVVSALADPDTIIINRSWNDRLSINEKQIGKKSVMITMSESGTVEQEVTADKSSVCTVSDEDAIRLADIALFLEKCFGTGRDIEWAIHDGKIFLLQSRPVTNENSFSEFEILHEFDSALKTDFEHYTTANVGEVIPGAVTPLTNTSSLRYMWGYMQQVFSYRIDCHRFDPTTYDGMAFFFGKFLLDQIQSKTWTLEKEKSVMSKSMDVGLFGRVLDDQDICEKALERFANPPLKAKLRITSYSIKGMLAGWYTMRQIADQFNSREDPSLGLTTIDDVYNSIDKTFNGQEEVLHAHVRVSFASNMFNMLTFNVLSGGKELTQENYTDFANLIGSGNGALSGEVPFRLKELARAIIQEIDATKFCSMIQEDALKWLQNNTSSPGNKFREFLTRHGHRGLQEFDMHTITWGMDPIKLIKILQDIAKYPATLVVEEADSTDLLKSLKSQLSEFRRKLLSITVRGSKMAICQREQTKSWMIKYFHTNRLAYRHLADLMVKEGYLPDPNLLFFLTHDEIKTLIQTRSANLLRMAKQRHRAYPTMNKLKFPEMMIGYPVPIDENEVINLDNNNQITGFPVSKGIVKGPAKVVLSLDQVHTIEPGDILITFGTDIGWSPYFPMLAGVVTEIGGLISHGAVVAREFGLPCIVGAQYATKVFKSGDIILLDATTGVISKVL